MTPNRRRFRGFHFAFAGLCAAVAACSPSIGSAQAGATDAPYSAALRAAAIDGAARPVRIAETANGGTWSLHDQLLLFADGFGQIYPNINLSERGYGTEQRFAFSGHIGGHIDETNHIGRLRRGDGDDGPTI